MRVPTAAGLFALLAAPALAADDAAAKKLEGTYEVLSMTVGGKSDPKLDEDKPKFVFKDGTISIRSEKKEKAETARYTVDPSKKPAEIDLVPPGKDETVLGIYEAKETDKGLELTLAFTKGPNNSPRPKDFKGEGERAVVLKLLRKK